MAKLILSLDGQVLKEIPLDKERLTIGRKPQNDIQIDNLAISGQHAVIVTILNDSFLEDLDSTNGTLVNGQPVKKHFLQHGDIIELNKFTLGYDKEQFSRDVSSIKTQRQAALRMLDGANLNKELDLVKTLTTLGKPGEQVAAIARRPDGYFITHVEGAMPPLVNGKPVGADAYSLSNNDVIDLAGIKMEFFFRNPA